MDKLTFRIDITESISEQADTSEETFQHTAQREMKNMIKVKRKGRQNEKFQNISNGSSRKRQWKETVFEELKDKFSNINERHIFSESRISVSSKKDEQK